MRIKTNLLVALLATAGMTCVPVSAQPKVANPFAEKITMQEYAINRSPGTTDGITWLKIAILYQDAARYNKAESAYQKAIALLKGKDRATFATALDHLGTMYVEQGKFSKAEPLERKALAIRRDAEDITGIGVTLTHLAMLSYGRHDMASAEANAEMAASLLIPEDPVRSAETHATPEEQMSALINLALIRCAKGACNLAIDDLTRALNLAHSHYAINSVPVGLIDFLLGYAHWKAGDNHSATMLMLAGTTEMEDRLGWGHPTFVAALRQYRSFLEQCGQAAQAKEVHFRIAKLERPPHTVNPASDGILFNLH